MRALVLLAIASGLSLPAHADGFPISDGRYVGKVTVLRLTESQTATLSDDRDLRLTAEQKAVLKASSGVAPSELYVYFTKDGENDHTCEAFNVAMRFSDFEIEVPHEYLVDDREAAERKQELSEEDEE